MKATLEFDTDEPQQNRELKECTRASDMTIALWDVDQLFRNVLKYENVYHKDYLTDEEDDVVTWLRKEFHKILEERDINFVLEG